jgi:mRNA-degrading endonuclease RelE of RelBE toxin-antitoxin system
MQSGIRVPDDVAAFIRSLYPDIKRKIKSGIKLILDNSNAGKALKSDLSGLFSLRIGRFRIIYKTVKNEIILIAVGPRKTIYEETSRHIKKQAEEKK